MSQKELLRLDLIMRVEQGKMTALEAARALHISLRQMRRLIHAFREEGPEGMLHGNRGRSPANRLAPDLCERIVRLLQGDYRDYNTSHILDELRSEHHLTISYTSLTRLRHEAGLASPASHRVRAHRLRRQRAARAGQLLQIDGSEHDWLEGRGPKLTLIAFIDDATGGIVAALFRQQEDAAGYMLALERVCRDYGVPQSLYSDRHTIFQSPKKPTLEERLAGQRPQSQFGRVMSQLGIVHLAAQSPQAKGRVERLFGTLQDRLVKALRQANACTLSLANQLLEAYLPKFNARFGQPPADPAPAYRPWTQGLVAAEVFSFQYTRVVANDHTISFGGLDLPLQPGPQKRHYARAQVQLYLQLDGCLRVCHQGQEIACFQHDPALPLRADHFVPAEPLVYTPTPMEPLGQDLTQPPKRTPTSPASSHPWRRSYKR